ncbi:MAG: hypothetical protein ACR2KV_12825 [Solirubrobacteraceae bacterium]
MTADAAAVIALLFQSKLPDEGIASRVNRRVRVFLGVFETLLTTALSVLAVGIGYLLFHPLLTDTRTIGDGDRRLVEWLLLFLFTGLGVIAVMNRVVRFAWKEAEAPYLDPELDIEVIAGILLAVPLGMICTASLVVLPGQLAIQWLVLLILASLAAAYPLVSSRFSTWMSRRWAARCHKRLPHGYAPSAGHVLLPDNCHHVSVTVYRSTADTAPEWLPWRDAVEVQRHWNGMRARLIRDATGDPTKLPAKLQLRRKSARSGFYVVGADPPTRVPLGFVAWGHAGPVLRNGDAPAPEQRAPPSRRARASARIVRLARRLSGGVPGA